MIGNGYRMLNRIEMGSGEQLRRPSTVPAILTGVSYVPFSISLGRGQQRSCRIALSSLVYLEAATRAVSETSTESCPRSMPDASPGRASRSARPAARPTDSDRNASLPLEIRPTSVIRSTPFSLICEADAQFLLYAQFPQTSSKQRI